jgi:hypothetical protein
MIVDLREGSPGFIVDRILRLIFDETNTQLLENLRKQTPRIMLGNWDAKSSQ